MKELNSRPLFTITMNLAAIDLNLLVALDDIGWGAGMYRLTASGIVSSLALCKPTRAGTNLVFDGAGGTPSGSYVVLTATEVVLPIAQWTPILSNRFGAYGQFEFTNAIHRAEPQRFFILREP